MQRLDANAGVVQAPRQAVGADLRANEDDGLLGPLGLEHPRERLALLAIGDLQVVLLDRVDREGRGLDLHRDRVVHALLGQPLDLGRHRGREEAGLAPGGTAREDGLHVLEEAQVEHLVGLVEHHEAGLVEEQVVAPDHVHHAADRAHHHVRLLEAGGLLADRRAPEHGDHVDPPLLAVGAERLGHLDAQLARGREHQRLDLGLLGIHELEHREAEGGRLAGAGLGLADHVAALEQGGDRLLLDGGRVLVAQMGQRVEDRFREALAPQTSPCRTESGRMCAGRVDLGRRAGHLARSLARRCARPHSCLPAAALTRDTRAIRRAPRICQSGFRPRWPATRRRCAAERLFAGSRRRRRPPPGGPVHGRGQARDAGRGGPQARRHRRARASAAAWSRWPSSRSSSSSGTART